ncbi:hypothetical protein M422DRAFT_251862 [Sphaerobolus stellatus SS14]|uniref:Cytochrome P450 n=1 Tax=Sphaerobolus stellatus (strain SS14) TaxID=990650 RepID=A0A0C9UNJ0_SPHS4|nr:hypothetical protein M422DRAFT_251862 [Sphaerobolus stellatus SS14]
MAISLLTTALLGGLAIFVLGLSRRTRIPKGLRLPPGPKPKPIIGNLLDLPKDHEWLMHAKWAKQYGELVYVNVLGTHMAWVNSREMAHELFERRSSNYSDRTTTTMLDDLLDLTGWLAPFQPYTIWCRRHRKTMHSSFHPKATEAYHPITYGIEVEAENDLYLMNAHKVLHAVDEAATPGNFLVDILPWMKYIPVWMPGAEFQRKAVKWRQYAADMLELPFREAKRRMGEGTPEACFVLSRLSEIGADATSCLDDEVIIKNTAASLFAGGTDTTVNTVRAFILAMVLYPDVQKKAQREIDALLGFQRLPDVGDMDALPYVMAVCKETLRWHALLPVGVAHMASEDDIINGYFIPKGTIMFGNSWTLLRDEADFGPNTDRFNPERYFIPGVRDPGNTGAFGFGRRICVGRYMAMKSVFLAIASILQVFEISKARDASDKEIPVEAEFTSGFFSFATEFKCILRPRSATAEELIIHGI